MVKCRTCKAKAVVKNNDIPFCVDCYRKDIYKNKKRRNPWTK